MTGNRRHFGFATALVFGLALTVSASAAVAAPAKVGELERTAVGSMHPYLADGPNRPISWSVAYPGATYIRVHFSSFDLAEGDSLTLSSPDGLQRFTYEGAGPHGSGEFWANTIVGDAAVVTLHAPNGGGEGFEIDSFGRGIVDIGGPLPTPPASPESVCGTQDWLDVKCYEITHPDEFASARAAVKALIGCCSSCTAFKVSDSGQFLTNNHCTSSQSGVQSTELRFEYQLSGCGAGTSGYTGSVLGSQLLATGATLDYTLMATSGDSSSIPCVTLANRLAQPGEIMYVAGHPSGGVKKLSIDSDLDGGRCRVGTSPCTGNAANSDVCYYCDTTNGSSGSPVFDDNDQVIALHHFGGCYNSGGRSDLILNDIGGLIGACSGGGGGTAVCGNGVQEPGEQCDGSDLNGQTCQTQGYPSGGTLACSSTCSFDTSGCVPCRFTGTACTTNAQCCSGVCKGSRGRKTCR